MYEAGEQVEEFLKVEVDLDFVSPALSNLGLKRGQLLEKDNGKRAAGSQSPACLTQEVVVDIEKFRVKEKQPDKFTVRWIRTLAQNTDSDKVLKATVKQLMASYTALVTNQRAGKALLSTFLATPFRVHQQDETTSSEKPPLSETSSTLSSARHLLKVVKDQSQLEEQVSSLEKYVDVLKQTVKELSLEKKDQCKQIDQSKKLVEDKVKLTSLVKDQREQLLDLKPNSDKLRYLKRRNIQLREKVRSAKALQERHNKLKKEHRELKQRSCTVKQTCERTVRRAKAKLLKLQGEHTVLQDQFPTELGNDGRQVQPQLRCSQNFRFKDNLRRTVMQLQSDCNVPAGKCSSVIKVVADGLFGVKYEPSDLPCLQTAVNIADEGHVLSKVQAAEQMLEVDNFTLHTDGTSRGGKKIMGYQITLDDGDSISLGFSTLATEDASTVLDVTVDLLKETTDLYCEGKEEDKDHTFRTLLSKLTSVMTDRAAVMKSFDEKLLSFLQSELGHNITLHFLHCNAHFLLGMSRSTEVALNKKEKELIEIGGNLGRDKLSKFQRFHKAETATARVIRLTSDITGPRGDEKNGCRAEWLAFCDQVGATSYITSYRSNRFNCYFETAAAIIYHLDHLRMFLTKGCLGHSNMKIESVIADLGDDILLSLVCAVAVLFFRLTGPFFQLVQSKVRYSDFHVYIQKMEAFVGRSCEDASDLLDPGYAGVFGDEFELTSNMKTTVLAYADQHYVAVKSALESVMTEVLLVIRRQLKDFLSDGQYGTALPAHTQLELQHCPLTNLIGENMFGDLDFDMSQKRNSSFHHRSSIHMMKHNKTSSWLSRKGPEEVSTLLSTARRRAKQLRNDHRQQERVVRMKIRERLQENERKKQAKEADAAQKQSEIIQRVLTNGGPCKKTGDINKLVSRLEQENRSKSQIKKILQDEIRYQKMILKKGKDLRIAGSLDDLQKALEDHFSGCTEGDAAQMDPSEGEDNADVPQPKRRRLDSHSEDQDASGTSENESDAVAFAFTEQGEWVSVYFDNQFYVGQVIEVHNPLEATIQYLEQTKGCKDYFRYPKSEDVARTQAEFVFRWKLVVVPIGTDSRIWKVSGIEEICEAYCRLRESA